MAQGQIVLTIDVAGFSLNSQINRPATGGIPHEATLAGAKEGTITDGTATLAADHGILTADVVDVYWSDGLRRGCTVGTVNGTAVPLTGGVGDSLPTSGEAIALAKQSTIDMDFVANLLQVLVANATKRASLEFFDADDVSLENLDLVADEPWLYVKNLMDNPLAGETVAYAKCSCGVAAGCTLTIAGTYDSVS
jgi:hypothetical protein